MTRDELKKFLEQKPVIRASAYLYDMMYQEMNRTSKNIINLDRYVNHLCDVIIHTYPDIVTDAWSDIMIYRLAVHETGMIISQKSFQLFEILRTHE